MADVSVFWTFIGGVFSFLSPCVLPLVPGYISIVSGVSLEQLKDEDQQKSLFRTIVLNSLMFILGFSITFILLGASATALGQVLVAQKRIIGYLSGSLLIVFGIHLTGLYRINLLYQDKRMHNISKPRGLAGALVLGLAFAFGWSPCLGPILAAVLTLAAEKETVGQGVFLLAVYSLGLGLPFLLTSLGINRFLAFYSRFKKHFHTLEVASGVMVIIIGVLIFTNKLTVLNAYLSFLNRFEKLM